MAAPASRDFGQRMERLDRMVDAYGHLLTASELERSLPGLVRILAAQGVKETEAAVLLKDILKGGGAQLLAELDEVERIARQLKDNEVFTTLNRVRSSFQFVAMYNAPPLLRHLEKTASASPAAASLQKEVQAFISRVARGIAGTYAEGDDLFAEEDMPGETATARPAPASEPAQPRSEAPPWRPATGPVPVPADSAQPPAVLEPASPEETAPDAILAPWLSAETDALSAPPKEARPASTRPAAAGGAEVEWVRERIDVFNEILLRWAANDLLDPETSPLVRRGQISAERSRPLYQELLAAGPSPILERLATLSDANGELDEDARGLRSRIIDGALAAVPRLLGHLARGGHLDLDLQGADADEGRVLADLTDYLAAAAELYDAGSPLRGRLIYLATELHTVLASRS